MPNERARGKGRIASFCSMLGIHGRPRLSTGVGPLHHTTNYEHTNV